MPIEMDYTLNGANHPNSWWVIGALNINLSGKTATVVEHGYHDRAAYDADHGDIIDTQILSTADPDIFDFYLGAINRSTEEVYITVIETWLWIGSPSLPEISGGFFSGATAVWSPVTVASAEIGGVSSAVLSVTFTDYVETGSDFEKGVTIRVNGVSIDVLSATQPADHRVVQYTLDSPVALNDTVTFEFDPAGASFSQVNGTGIGSIPPTPVTNTIGCYLRFDDPNNSMWMMVM